MKNLLFYFLLVIFLPVIACSDDDTPEAENEEEEINEVILSFTPAAGGAPLQFVYQDPDGSGTTPATKDLILLNAETIYLLNISFKNTLGQEEIDLTEEIRNEGEEHQIFFGWNGPFFTSPTGLGNIGEDNQSNEIIYLDEDRDSNNLPVGLATLWETKTSSEGAFRIILKHQPGIKTANSSTNDGVTDVDITWDIKIN